MHVATQFKAHFHFLGISAMSLFMNLALDRHSNDFGLNFSNDLIVVRLLHPFLDE
jgi:hypothetical protein